MNYKFPVQQLVCLALVALTFACKKTNTINVNIQQPAACFTTQIKDSWSSYLRTADANYIDSVFYFRNCSDSTASITYLWDFGDGATSTEKNPVHHYSKRGRYTVTLEVNDNNLATDTIQKTVTVISGQKEIGFGEGHDAFPIAIDETASGDFLLLGSTGYDAGFFLMQLDSLFQQKGQPKYLPASYRLTSMKPTSDGNYIFTGTTSGFTRNNELIKLKPDGTFIWNRISTAADDYYLSATPSPDGGYVVVSAQPGKDQYNNPVEYARLKKFDANGNMQWDRSLYAEGMEKAKEVAFEQDAVIVAGKKRWTTCYDCDSVVIAKLDNAGGLVWKNTVYGGLNVGLGYMRIIKHSAGNYVVATEGARGIFVFSPAGAFLDRKLVNSAITAISNTGDGNLAVLQTEGGNGFRGAVSKIKMDGTQLWYVIPNGQQQMGTGWLCCVDSWPIAIQPLRNGGVLAMMRRVNHNTANYNFYYVMSFLPLSENGVPK
jgi:PKD repeat protein